MNKSILGAVFSAILLIVATNAHAQEDGASDSVVISDNDGATRTDEDQPIEPLPADYSIKLKDLEQQVNQLKERIHQSKSRLVQLQEVVINGTINGARAKIIHKNELGTNYRIARIQYSLDSQPIYNRVAVNGDLDKLKDIVIFEDALNPGNHLLSVYIELQGNGHKIFSYMDNYQFKLKSSHTFTADVGKMTTVAIVPQLKGNGTYSVEERPSIRYDVERKKALREELEDNGVLPLTKSDDNNNAVKGK